MRLLLHALAAACLVTILGFVDSVSIRVASKRDDDGDEPAFVYVSSNSNTRPPQSLEDEIVPDINYHNLPKALQIIAQWTTTTPAPETENKRGKSNIDNTFIAMNT